MIEMAKKLQVIYFEYRIETRIVKVILQGAVGYIVKSIKKGTLATLYLLKIYFLILKLIVIKALPSWAMKILHY
jgi:hypothetical protein